MDEYTKGEATTEKWGDPNTDPTWAVKLGGEIRFQTIGDDDEANAKEFVRRWNNFSTLEQQCDMVRLENEERYRKKIEKLLKRKVSLKEARAFLYDNPGHG